MRPTHTATLVLAALALAACSQSPDAPAGAAATESAAATTDDSALGAGISARPVATGTPAASGATLALDGLGKLAIGRPASADSGFAERGAQTGESCRMITSPEFPGVYAITSGKDGPVRRITVGQGSAVKLAEGIGVGSGEAAALASFPGFVSSPHKYVGPPAKDLVQPGRDPRLRFEIGQDGKVGTIHVGVMPELGYVEGCS